MSELEFPAGVHKLTRIPKGNDVKGKVWWEADVYLPNGEKVNGRFESTRGAFVYFKVGEQHYRAFVERFQDQEASAPGVGVFRLEKR